MRIAAVIVAFAAAAACSPDLVETERADVAVGPVPTADTSSGPPLGPEATPEPDVGAPETTDQPTTSPPLVEAPDEAERRPPDLGIGDDLFPGLGSADVDVVSYHVELDIDPAVDRVDASIDVVLRLAGGVDAVPLDQIGLEVTEARIDGTAVGFETTESELLIALPGEIASSSPEEPVEVLVEVDYSFRALAATSDLVLPAGWFANPDTGQSYVLNQPDGTRMWLPSNDHPSDKATWTFDVTVPEGFVAVANGELLGRPSGGVDRPWSWREDEPMSTYLVQLIVGDYEIVVPESLTSADGDEIALSHVVPAGERDAFDDVFATVDEQLAFFEERFGPYPLARYGLAFVADLSNVAMETQGRSMFGASDFRGRGLGFLQQLLLAHELAHQWFGNAVSPADWSDIWLNESITTYAQWLWLDEVGLQPLDTFADLTLAQRQNGSGSTGDPERADMFGFNSYDGGAVVVHALRRTIGDEAFFELLTTWVTEFWGTAQTTETFIGLAEAIHGEDLTVFFDDWLFATDLPDRYP